jgi:hypothetical protein
MCHSLSCHKPQKAVALHAAMWHRKLCLHDPRACRSACCCSMVGKFMHDTTNSSEAQQKESRGTAQIQLIEHKQATASVSNAGLRPGLRQCCTANRPSKPQAPPPMSNRPPLRNTAWSHEESWAVLRSAQQRFCRGMQMHTAPLPRQLKQSAKQQFCKKRTFDYDSITSLSRVCCSPSAIM